MKIFAFCLIICQTWGMKEGMRQIGKKKTAANVHFNFFFNEPWLLFNYKWRWTVDRQKYRWFLRNMKGLCPSSGWWTTGEEDEGRDRGNHREQRSISNNTMVKQYKAHFSYRILQNEKKIYVQNIKTWEQLFLPLLYIMWGLWPASSPY